MRKPLTVFIEMSKYNSMVLDCASCTNQNTICVYLLMQVDVKAWSENRKEQGV